VIAAVLAAAGAPAGAHGGAGEIVLAGAEPAGPATLALAVEVAYVNDGHPAEVRSLVLEATGPEGTALGPVEPFRPADVAGRYEGTVAFPAAGTWELTVTSTFPPGRLDATVVVPADDPPPTTATSGAVRTTAPLTTATPATPATTATATSGAGSGAVAWLLGGTALTAALVAGFVLARRRGG
jgi:hypothetical protein